MRKLDTKEFIRRAKEIHGNKYDYSHANYKGTHICLKIKCKIHGFFDQKPSSHLLGKGCLKCGFKSGAKLQRRTTQQFIKEARQVHGKTYGYDKVDYKGNHTKVKIECKTHGIFEQIPSNHLKGHNCLKCGMKSCAKSQSRTKQQFIKDAKRVHGNKYDYSHVDYVNTKSLVKIKCKVHGFFNQIPVSHINGKAGCKKCINQYNSKGVQAIELFLKQNKIDYERERRFPDLRNKRPLPLDFWLPKLKIAIEFDGKQHSKISAFSATKEKLRLIQKRDRIKNEWAKKQRYTMIRISYIQQNNINAILLKGVID